jgi:transposase
MAAHSLQWPRSPGRCEQGRLARSADLIEARRDRALRLLDEGYTLNEVGRMVDSADSSVMRWRDARERDGEVGLRARFSPGRPATLTEAQRRRLVELLHGPRFSCRKPERRALQRDEERIERWDAHWTARFRSS